MKQLIFRVLLLVGIFSSTSIADITSNLEVHYAFDNNLVDAANSNNLSVAGGGSAAYEAGKIGNAYTFNGLDNELSNSAMGYPDLTTGTVSFWIKTTNNGTHSLVIMGDAVNDADMDSSINGISNMNAGGITVTSAGINDGNWHHIVFTFDGTTNVYIDNVFKQSGASGSTEIDTYLQVGGYNNSFRFSGAMDSLRIYSRVLSVGDIAELYNEAASVSTSNSVNVPISNLSYLFLILSILGIVFYKKREMVNT